MRRGDLSSPIIALLLTIVAVAAGVIAGMWLLRTGGQLSHQTILTISGQPVIVPSRFYTVAYVTITNVGDKPVTIYHMAIRYDNRYIYMYPDLASFAYYNRYGVVLGPGETDTVVFVAYRGINPTNSTVVGVIVTSRGTIPVVLYVVNNAPEEQESIPRWPSWPAR